MISPENPNIFLKQVKNKLYIYEYNSISIIKIKLFVNLNVMDIYS